MFRNQASRTAGAPPPSSLPSTAPTTEQPLGQPGILAWGRARVPLGFTSPGSQWGQVGTFYHCGTTWAPLPAQKGLENARGHLANDWQS